jgi:hypothetical protein
VHNVGFLTKSLINICKLLGNRFVVLGALLGQPVAKLLSYQVGTSKCIFGFAFVCVSIADSEESETERETSKYLDIEAESGSEDDEPVRLTSQIGDTEEENTDTVSLCFRNAAKY